MLCVKTKVKRSPVHGWGLFAGQDIEKGQPVWRWVEGHDLEFPASEVDGLDGESRAYAAFYGSRERGVVSIDGDAAKYMNHSRSPNLRTGRGREVMYAVRAIKAGEELTCDYREFDEPSRQGEEPYV